MNEVKVAIVILNWNGSSMLKKYLPTLIKHTQCEQTRIYVADNYSTDDSVEMLKNYFPEIPLILLDKNWGFAQGYNLALQQIDARYYILLNSDVEVSNGWLQPLVSYMDAHANVAACQPKLLDLKARNRFEYAGAAGGYMDKWGYMFCRGRIFDTIEQDNGQYNTVTELFWATGACLMIRSVDYWAVGGLDGRFFAHQEEIDLCWRLRSRNRSIVCVPESVVYHLGGATLNKSNPYKTFLNFRNNLLMLYKNLPQDELSRVMRVRFWLDIIAALSFLAKFHWGDFCAVLRARREFRRLRPEFYESRNQNLADSLITNIPERKNYSLLWQYYVKRHKQFSQYL